MNATNDPLARYRPGQASHQQPPATNRPSPQVAPTIDDELTPPTEYRDQEGRRIYQAFRASPRKCDRLEIRLASGIWQYPRYFDLRDISADARQWVRIVLHFTMYDVLIDGRNLHPLLYTLKQSRCDYIQEFHAPAFSPERLEEDPNPAFIARLHIEGKKPAEEKQPPQTAAQPVRKELA